MPRFLPGAMTALAALASHGTGCLTLASPDSVAVDDSRLLASLPTGFGDVGPTLFGVRNSADSSTSSFVEFGATAVLSSADGHRLAVGAPKHDWTASGGGATGLNEDGGAIFVYDYNDVTLLWDLKAEFYGSEGEKLGDRLSLSADGTRIAIRRYNNGPDHVEVYDLTSPVLGTVPPRVGTTDIYCPSTGQHVELTADGSRMAVSCELADGGEVQIYDYNATSDDWDPVGLLQNELSTTEGSYGYKAAWDSTGTKIAVSAPNYDGGTTGRGMVRVFEFQAVNSWTQLGTQIDGTDAGEKFGTSLDISADGTTLIVGSPARMGANGVPAGGAIVNDQPAGAVTVYEYTAGDWSPVYSIEGEGANDKFGRTVHVTDSGDKFVASSFAHDSGHGYLRVFELPLGGSWGPTGEEFKGLTAGGRLGGGILGFSMIGDGTRLAAGSTRASTNGIVEVWDTDFTSQPSSSPSAAPTLFIEGVGYPGPFMWELYRVGNATAAFTEEADTSEIQLEYQLTWTRNFTVQVMDYATCSTPVDSNVADAIGTVTAYQVGIYDNMTVSVDIKQDAVVGSSLWSNDVTNGGTIRMCIRVDLVTDDEFATSVNFHEQKLEITIGLLQGFEVTNIDLDRLAADEEEESADFEYELTACQCNSTWDCVPSVLNQGDSVYICIETEAPDVIIQDIQYMIFTQGSFNVTAISGGSDGPLTQTLLETNDGTAKAARVQHQMISEFFEDPSPGNVTAIGTALLAFSNTRQRNLRAKIVYDPTSMSSANRALADAEEGIPDVTFALNSAENPGSGAAGGHVCMSMVAIVAGVAIALVG